MRLGPAIEKNACDEKAGQHKEDIDADPAQAVQPE
jgi:hypothetical protein